MLRTKIDDLYSLVESLTKVSVAQAAKDLDIPKHTVLRIARYFEQLGYVEIDYKHVSGPMLRHLHTPESQITKLDERELMEKLRLFESTNDVQAANQLLYDVYKYCIKREDADKKIYNNVRDFYVKHFTAKGSKTKEPITKLDTYEVHAGKVTVEVDIIKQELTAVPFYLVSILKFTELTQELIDLVREEVIGKISYKTVLKLHKEQSQVLNEYREKILAVMQELLPELSPELLEVCCEYIIITSTGLGEIEILLKDASLEEVVINNAYEPLWVYHKKYGWLETNITLDDESKITHYATLAGRLIDKTITNLTPLLDARLKSGDRVNATMWPITSKGSTITIRKFAEHPWTITDFLLNKTIDLVTAAMVWEAIQYELSILIVGGTGSGKTSTLNVFSQFIPTNQRIVSIEDTREIRLPDTLHWVPMETRLPNPEGRGGVSMLDLIVNSLRMRPDRIIVGEIRRKKEAEVLFEAMHTGHSVYATLHANTVDEAITRLTTDPIGISKTLLAAVDLVFVQNRNRRTNTRRTFQMAEISKKGDAQLLYQYDFSSDSLAKVKEPSEFYRTLQLFSGLSKQKVNQEINEKIAILKYLVKNKITSIEEVAQIFNYYYIDKDYLAKNYLKKKD
ncbi:type II/IV secretion system ATPase subunit, partial [Candidatus Woesearchaeota archaeon]|nr:type II/IV secretion system ATPase subunit [Candidatus Woesearchaeota archaeon]